MSKEPYNCLSCPNIITTGDYCSECSDAPDGRPEVISKSVIKRLAVQSKSDKSQAEIEKLDTYYSLYDKSIKAHISRIKELEDMLTEEADNHDKTMSKIMDYEQQIDDTENALTGAIDCINDMKCCGNCDQENLQSDCLISESDIRGHNYVCDNWLKKQ